MRFELNLENLNVVDKVEIWLGIHLNLEILATIDFNSCKVFSAKKISHSHIESEQKYLLFLKFINLQYMAIHS